MADDMGEVMKRVVYVVYNSSTKKFLSSKRRDAITGEYSYNKSFRQAVLFKGREAAINKTEDNGNMVVVPVEMSLSKKDLFLNVMSWREKNVQ